MSNEKEENSGWNKKKYLYLDKFTEHVKTDKLWKEKSETVMIGTHKLLIVTIILSLAALIIAIVK
jgi:ABC-type phosphate transport system permease subunit